MPKTWFVTGASRGIGAEVVMAALAAGDQVVATGRKPAQIAKIFEAYSDRVLAVELDVTKEAQAFVAVEAAIARFGRIDVLVNNAGYGQLGAFEANEAIDVEQQFATNVFGLFHVTRAVLPVMRRQRAGRILNISSVAGVVGFPDGSLYCSSKFAVEGFSESLAQEVAPFGILVTSVEPGVVHTEFLDDSSVRYGSGVIEDYAQFSADSAARWDELRQSRGSDPARLAAALITLVSVDKPPMHFPCGSDAIELIGGKLMTMRDEIDQWRELSSSTDMVVEGM